MKSTLVWDWPVRVSHWLMVLLFTGLIVSGKLDGQYIEYHFYMGYSLSAVVIARILYGFYGSYYARFRQFIKGPKAVADYLVSVLKGKPQAHLGHNPLGGLMVVVLLGALTVQWGTGLFSSDEIFWSGPFNGLIPEDWASELASLHHILPDVLIGLVAVHIAAVLYHEIQLKERLIHAMVNGKKPYHKTVVSVSTPRWGVIFSLFIGFAWLVALWLMPV
ncbi:cytochrome b/b6 domain-containing protein [Marinomonas sp. IMCC 4694]|uniref:cytochrome b/b6 domain-containing protein n=1 Tax=Marinomonas sp. IMCC 4694 TaxID=2605432 RepID=UPI0011E79FE3|nr:cytochrome b/b6 domain-containing protein [Marinomonas sp. IMCC 4694]TYL48816.1 branched-chain alpha-keto acid dehydrogenase subunit E2 [Marinomonas sp. IMCC 4694]